MKFEEAMCRVLEKPLREMTDAELREHQIRLRQLHTDIPDSPHRRKPRYTQTAMGNLLAEVAAKLGKTPEEIMDLPEVKAILGGADDNAKDREST